MARRLLLLTALAAAVPAAAPAGAVAGDGVLWLCRPGASGNPCAYGRDAAVFAPPQRRVGTRRSQAAARPPIDCFYVYPTVSDQPGPQARRIVTDEERGAAVSQASRFSELCRVWAPIYRQITVRGLLSPDTVTPAMRARAYDDVRAAWRTYVRRHNRGRGVVILGHSQGSRILRRLIADEIDPRPAVRRLLVSAIIPGANVTVARGRDVGGDFSVIRTCRSPTQLACVVSYSVFDETPPDSTRFGFADSPFSRARLNPARFAAACTNPAALAGGTGRLTPYFPTAIDAAGTVATLERLQVGPLPAVSQPWVTWRAAYSSRCERRNGANVLFVRALNGMRDLSAQPTPDWGLHISDVNLALGELTTIVRRQRDAYLRRGSFTG